MTTALNLVDETRRYLFAGQRENLNALNGSHDASVTTFNFTYDLGPLQTGSYLSVDLEILYVWAVSGSGLSATVQRGMLGSTAAVHAASSIVYVNSKFPAFGIFQALNADLDDLCSPTNGLYAVINVEQTFNPAVYGYDLTGATDVLDILRVRQKTPGPWLDWPQIRKYRLERNAETDDFPSGFAVMLREARMDGAGRELRITYSAPFTHFTDLTTTCASVGLPTTANDLPPLGAAMRLAGVRETQRNFNESQGDTRRASEVPPGSQAQGMRALAALRQARIHSEADKLSSSYPTRRQG